MRAFIIITCISVNRLTRIVGIVPQETLQMANKVVVIYSGGMDSFTVLNRALKDGKEVEVIPEGYIKDPATGKIIKK